MTQAERILNHIEEHGSITALEAVMEYGILQLSARICELQRKGYVFAKEIVEGKNRFGEPVRFVRYSAWK